MAEKTVLPTYKRQRFLLSFISQLPDEIAFTNLQKLVFLYTMREKTDFYEFVPYKFGPYSFQLREDVDFLRKNGFLSRESFGIVDQLRICQEKNERNCEIFFCEGMTKQAPSESINLAYFCLCGDTSSFGTHQSQMFLG